MSNGTSVTSAAKGDIDTESTVESGIDTESTVESGIDTESTVEESTAEKLAGKEESAGQAQTERRPASKLAAKSVSVKTVVVWAASVVVVIAVVASISILAWQLNSKSSELDDINSALAGQKRAEQVSLDYATGAAQMDFNDLDAWKSRLTEGTTPELTNRLEQAATSMQQLIQPMQWTSTATPITSKVESVTDGVYQVVTFVNVTTKNTQTPDGIESTATYKMSIDSNNDWVINEISGLDSAIDPAAPK